MNENILKISKIEAEWIRYYGHKGSREAEKFEDINFYDRIVPIGYSKVYTPLSNRCPMGYVYKLDNIDDKEIIYGPINHDLNIYTALEFVIYNKIDGYKELINIIKK